METVGSLPDIIPSLATEAKAQKLFAKLRWPDGVRCPRCDHDRVYVTKGVNEDRPQWKCAKCRRKFSCTTGTIFEASHIPMRHWLYAMFTVCASRKGVSAKQIQRTLNITYKAAWFMMHRLRWAMTQEPLTGMLGGAGKIVEADETYVGGRRAGKRGRGAAGKTIVMALLDRDGGKARVASVPNVRGKTLKDVISQNVHETSTIATDSLSSYKGLDQKFAAHGTVDHNTEYVRGVIHTNFAESYFSLLKRGLYGTFHHVSQQHMDRYLNEFSFRWNNRELADGALMVLVVQYSEGMRLTYKPTKSDQGGGLTGRPPVKDR